MVAIYKDMYTVHCENTLRIETIECINNESLDFNFGVCALVGGTNYTILHNYFKRGWVFKFDAT